MITLRKVAKPAGIYTVGGNMHSMRLKMSRKKWLSWMTSVALAAAPTLPVTSAFAADVPKCAEEIVEQCKSDGMDIMGGVRNSMAQTTSVTTGSQNRSNGEKLAARQMASAAKDCENRQD